MAIMFLIAYSFWRAKPGSNSAEQFIHLMNTGKNYIDQGQPAKAVDAFSSAASINPSHPDAQLNLAISYLFADQPEQALKHAAEAVRLNGNLASAYYVAGSAHMRLAQYEPALQNLQQAQRLAASIPAVYFQVGLAHQKLNQWEAAANAFQTAIDLQPEHPAAHYSLSQALARLGRTDEAAQEVEIHNEIISSLPGGPPTLAQLEQCELTEPQVPFQLEQPDPEGISVVFTDTTATALEGLEGQPSWQGPFGLLDVTHDNYFDLFVREGTNAFRILTNSNGVFRPMAPPMPSKANSSFHQILIGDLQNDRGEDIIALGVPHSQVFRVSTNGTVADATLFSRLGNVAAQDGVLVDLDFTGKLDLVAVTPTNSLRVLRNLGNFAYKDFTATSGVSEAANTIKGVLLEDWNSDDLMDVIATSEGAPPILFIKQRGGPLVRTNFGTVIVPPATVSTTGDLNNDLHTDLVLATPTSFEVILNGSEEGTSIPHSLSSIHQIGLVDYDNDGWLDLVSAGQEGLRAWRNTGLHGFKPATADLKLDKLDVGAVHSFAAVDFDLDGDSDLILSSSAPNQGNGAIRLLRNEGGNANHQIKIRLRGNRSNNSGLGTRIEVTAGGLRLIRTVTQLPIEIGIGKHQAADSVTIRWLDLAITAVDLKADPGNYIALDELKLPTGSCPYLYAWNGEGFTFITDLLGAAPAGLPIAENRLIEADPDELVWIGTESFFKPLNGEYVLQITEELREVLYLDEAKLLVVDHPPNTETAPLDKLLPMKPFPESEIVTLQNPVPLQNAQRSDGLDITQALLHPDDHVVSPFQLRPHHLRGLAEPYDVTLDFGPLNSKQPLVLKIKAWLQFGGGSANIAASQDPDLPFPFPTLQVEGADGSWHPVDVQFGAPAGKTKIFMVDLTGKLPEAARRLRISTAFEIHWDQIQLFEKTAAETRLTYITPTSTDLHWRGFSEYKNLPGYLPLTPDYENVSPGPKWRTTPAGWCTRYGSVDELIASRDDALVLLNGGDELTLRFAQSALPEKPEGFTRDFYLLTVGWDKDADFHVRAGWTVEPLPFHGMDDQQYGKQQRPAMKNDGWMEEYNTRWVGPKTFTSR